MRGVIIKKLLVGLFLVLIFFINTPSLVIAAGYGIGVKKNDEIIWTCNTCNDEKMEQLFGKNWNNNNSRFFRNMEEGSFLKWKITDINEKKIYSNTTGSKEIALTMKYDVWIWRKDEEWGTRDHEEQNSLFKNPNHFSNNFIFNNFTPLWLPVPIGEYIKDLEPNLYNSYSVDGRVLLSITFELEKNELNKEYPSEYIKVLAIYNGEGILRSYKLYIKDHVVIIDISLKNLNIFNIIFVITILILSYVGLIYLTLKID